MKILAAIKSMSQPYSRHHEKGQEEDSVLFGITPMEAKERIANVMSSFVVKRKSEASETLRALCSHPDSGKQLPKMYELCEGDVIVIAPRRFNEEDVSFSPHGMIVCISNTNPLQYDIYEQSIDMRNEHSIKIGLPLQTRYFNQKMHYVISPSAQNDRVDRYIYKNIIHGHAFKLKLKSYHIYEAFINVVNIAETKRRSLSKVANSQAPAYYGTARCNNVVHDVVVEALKIRNNNLGGNHHG
jgi:hypothetical protein